MPSAAIESAETYKPPHERAKGPWSEYELDDMGRHVEIADKVKSNPHLTSALAKHHEKKAKRHHEIAAKMRPAMKRGLVSETAATKASIKNLEADRGGKYGNHG